MRTHQNRRYIKSPPPTDPNDIWMAEIYSSLKQERDKEEIKTREDQVNLACLRARTHPALGENKLKIDATDATYPRCKSAVEDLEHWLYEYQAMSARRI